jgi:SAM-dependent methyltransferase
MKTGSYATSEKLFPNSECYVLKSPIEAGFFDLEIPHRFRWIGREAHCVLPAPNFADGAVPVLMLTLNTHAFGWTPHLSVEVNGMFLGTQAITNFGNYYFPLDCARFRSTDTLAITLQVNHVECIHEGQRVRNVALPIYDVRVLDLCLDEGFGERALFLEQAALFRESALPQILVRTANGPEAKILELGAGMGWMTFLLAAYLGTRTVGVDQHAYLSAAGDGFKRELARRMARHLSALQRQPGFAHVGDTVEVRRIVDDLCDFYTMDAESLWLRDELVDFAFSLNAFEHISRPDRVLAEIRRLLKPGGEVLIYFHLPYFSDGGHHLHACGLLSRPWIHLLHDRETIRRMVREAGNPDVEVDKILNSLNGWSIRQFEEAFANCGLTILSKELVKGFTVPGAESSPEFAELKRTHSLEDLTTIGMRVHLQKA